MKYIRYGFPEYRRSAVESNEGTLIYVPRDINIRQHLILGRYISVEAGG
jgi:hypothetical protein